MAEPSEIIANPKSIVEQGYDLVADKFLAAFGPRPSKPRSKYLEKLLGVLPEGARILELGCGAGVPATQELVKHGLDVVGNDISASQIALAREHVRGATFIHGDMMELSFEPGSFEAVIALYSLFHLPKEEHGKMIGQITGWLKEGGWLLVNLHVDEGDVIREDWMGAKMFSTGLGVEGNRDVFRKHGVGMKVIDDEIVGEKVGRSEENFHWFLAVKTHVEDIM
jgi:SAM-dependent methyltransferase